MNSHEVAQRIREVGQRLDKAGLEVSHVEQLFAIVDTLRKQHSVLTTLTDPTRSAAQRVEIARFWFRNLVSEPVLNVFCDLISQDWDSGVQLVDILEDRTFRQLLRYAHLRGELDQVREELFRFGRTVVANPELRQAINNPVADTTARINLVRNVLGGKVSETTLQLAVRAVRSRDQYIPTLQKMLDLASELRHRKLARVYVAKPLSAAQQRTLTEQLNRIYAAAMDLEIHVTPEVIGGVRVQVDDDVIDGSLAGRLANANMLLRS